MTILRVIVSGCFHGMKIGILTWAILSLMILWPFHIWFSLTINYKLLLWLGYAIMWSFGIVYAYLMLDEYCQSLKPFRRGDRRM
jgi:hypothetical protein